MSDIILTGAIFSLLWIVPLGAWTILAFLLPDTD